MCTCCKYETLLFCKPRTQFVLLLYINKVYWIKILILSKKRGCSVAYTQNNVSWIYLRRGYSWEGELGCFEGLLEFSLELELMNVQLSMSTHTHTHTHSGAEAYEYPVNSVNTHTHSHTHTHTHTLWSWSLWMSSYQCQHTYTLTLWVAPIGEHCPLAPKPRTLLFSNKKLTVQIWDWGTFLGVKEVSKGGNPPAVLPENCIHFFLLNALSTYRSPALWWVLGDETLNEKDSLCPHQPESHKDPEKEVSQQGHGGVLRAVFFFNSP